MKVDCCKLTIPNLMNKDIFLLYEKTTFMLRSANSSPARQHTIKWPQSERRIMWMRRCLLEFQCEKNIDIDSLDFRSHGVAEFQRAGWGRVRWAKSANADGSTSHQRSDYARWRHCTLQRHEIPRWRDCEQKFFEMTFEIKHWNDEILLTF